MRINLEPGTSVDSLAGKLARIAGPGVDEAFVDAFAVFPSLDQMLDFGPPKSWTSWQVQQE